MLLQNGYILLRFIKFCVAECYMLRRAKFCYRSRILLRVAALNRAMKLTKFSSGIPPLKVFGVFFTHLSYKTFQCLLNMNPYFSTRFIPSRLQHFMLIWEFWRNGATVGLGIRPLEVLWPGISQKLICRYTNFQHFSIYIFFFSNFFFVLNLCMPSSWHIFL